MLAVGLVAQTDRFWVEATVDWLVALKAELMVEKRACEMD